jgi:hypothetical protein
MNNINSTRAIYYSFASLVIVRHALFKDPGKISRRCNAIRWGLLTIGEKSGPRDMM